jgi:hypothetical protein
VEERKGKWPSSTRRTQIRGGQSLCWACCTSTPTTWSALVGQSSASVYILPRARSRSILALATPVFALSESFYLKITRRCCWQSADRAHCLELCTGSVTITLALQSTAAFAGHNGTVRSSVRHGRVIAALEPIHGGESRPYKLCLGLHPDLHTFPAPLRDRPTLLTTTPQVQSQTPLLGMLVVTWGLVDSSSWSWSIGTCIASMAKEDSGYSHWLHSFVTTETPCP